MSRIILASASPRRRELLTQIGLEFEIMPSSKEEKSDSRVPSEMVSILSRCKAEDIVTQICAQQGVTGERDHGNLMAQLFEKVIVIGADTIVVYGDTILGKPKDRQDAVEMLSLLQGQTHQVYTGVTIIWQSENSNSSEAFHSKFFYEQTDVTMYSMTRQEIEDYVATGEPLDKAGAYGIQGRCAAFIKEINGDYNNVVGLPIGRLYQEMKALGVLPN